MIPVKPVAVYAKGGDLNDLEEAVWGGPWLRAGMEADLALSLAEFEAGHLARSELQFKCELYVFETTGTHRYPDRPEIPNNFILGED